MENGFFEGRSRTGRELETKGHRRRENLRTHLRGSDLNMYFWRKLLGKRREVAIKGPYFVLGEE